MIHGQQKCICMHVTNSVKIKKQLSMQQAYEDLTQALEHPHADVQEVIT